MPTKPKKTKSIIDFYNEAKSECPDAMIVIRCGDFYEFFGQDARDAAAVLNLTLTRRTKAGGSVNDCLLMAGFPYYQLENYLQKLVSAGFRVAVCEQFDDANIHVLKASYAIRKAINSRPVDAYGAPGEVPAGMLF